LGTFSSYEEAKARLYDRFDELFNRPSKNAIEHGASPRAKVWDYTEKGRDVKRSISIIEGDEVQAVLGASVTSVQMSPKGRKQKSYQIRIPDMGMPTIITVRTLYPSYFKHVKQIQAKRIGRVKRLRAQKKS